MHVLQRFGAVSFLGIQVDQRSYYKHHADVWYIQYSSTAEHFPKMLIEMVLLSLLRFIDSFLAFSSAYSVPRLANTIHHIG